MLKDKIALAIEDTGDSPLDSKLEAVLPGVHQRLVANQRVVLSLQNFVEKGISTLGTKVIEDFECQEEAVKEQDQKTGEAYMSLAQGLMGQGSSPARRPFRRNRTLEEDENFDEQEDQDATTNRVMARPHSTVMKH